MEQIKLKDATDEQLQKHYKYTEYTRLEFDEVRPSLYESKFGNISPMIQHYKQYLMKKGFLYIGVKV